MALQVTPRGVPILAYHEISDVVAPAYRKYIVTPATFDRQMRWLSEHGYTSVSLDDVLAARRGEIVLPRRPVVLTFDDGCRDCVEHAGPILERHGFGAAFFVVTELVGTTSRWLLAEGGLELPLADWAAIRRLVDRGFDCGSHSCTHVRLSEVGADECCRQLVESKRVLEDRLERAVDHVAYPFGVFDGSVAEAAAEAGYRSALTMRIGHSLPAEAPLELRRVPINGDETFQEFVWRVRTARRPADLVRVARRVLSR